LSDHSKVLTFLYQLILLEFSLREKFNTYRFADNKEKVIDLLGRVTSVSVETQRIVEEMKKVPR